MEPSAQKQGTLCKMVKSKFEQRMIGKFQLATRQLEFTDHRGLQMPPLREVRPEAKEVKRPKVHLLEQAESSFIIKADKKEVNKV